MRKFFRALIVVPLGLIFIVFAVANRHFVTVSFDPFNSADPSVAVRLPLFVLIIMVAILGVVAGGSATWLRQRRWRRAARQHEADARAARSEVADLRAAASTRYDRERLPLPRKRVHTGLPGETSKARRCKPAPPGPLDTVLTGSGRPKP